MIFDGSRASRKYSTSRRHHGERGVRLEHTTMRNALFSRAFSMASPSSPEASSSRSRKTRKSLRLGTAGTAFETTKASMRR
jgi:hypothetical protein